MIFIKIHRIIILAAISITAIFSGCVKGDFDQAPLLQTFQLDSGDTLVSIMELKKLHNEYSDQLDSITRNFVIKGVVISNDSCGNTYKALTIQDASCGIALAIDNSDIYQKYYLGQTLYVKCKGLILGGRIFSLSGPHMTATQLGYREGLAIGTIPDQFKTKYIFRDGFIETAPAPREFTSVNQMVAAGDTVIGTLVKLKGVKFVGDLGALYNQGNPAPIQNITDASGTQISLYSSPYSCFAKDSLPSLNKICDITGILSTYDASSTQSGFQLIIRTKKDVVVLAK